MRAAQRLGGRHHVPGVHAGADVGGGEGYGLVAVVLGQQRHGFDCEPEPLAGAPQGLDVAGRLLTEGEVLPHHDLDHVQVFHQQLVDVALRRELHEIAGERHHQEDVDAQLLDELGAAGERGQLRRVAAGIDHFHRVRVEGHEDRRHVAGAAGLDRVRDQLGVAAVHAIEHPDGEHASAPIRGNLVLAAPPLHDRKPTAPARSMARQIAGWLVAPSLRPDRHLAACVRPPPRA